LLVGVNWRSCIKSTLCNKDAGGLFVYRNYIDSSKYPILKLHLLKSCGKRGRVCEFVEMVLK
jgi:hypothetical protein